jgi:hypothetical protein
MFKTTQTFTLQAKIAIGEDNKVITDALSILASELSAKELTAIAKVVKNDPIKLGRAKSFLGLK